MSALSPILRDAEGGRLNFWCPGCNAAHGVAVGEGEGPRWGYNGNPHKPTFTPSIKVTSGHFMDGHTGSCWCSFNAKKIARGEKGSGFKCFCCHSYVKDGRIEFLSDCTHALVGQTVDLPPWPDRRE